MRKKCNVVAGILLSLSALFLLGGLAFMLLDVGVIKSPHRAMPKETEVQSASEETVPESKNDIVPLGVEPLGSVETEIIAVPAPEDTAPEEAVAVSNPYAEYYAENEDMVGWLKIPDTIVDFPVMWTPFDENYYLLRGFDKKYSGNGCLILDTDSNMYPLTTNLIIHGHNNPHAMFGELDQYENQDYRNEHPYIYLYGKDYEHIYEVMAVFRSKVFYKSDVCFKYYKFFEAQTEDEFNDFYDNVKQLSYYDTGVEAEFGDHLLTLSTCSYHVENGRFVIVAKEIEPGDSYESLD